jgi:hypothetical protein
MLQTIVSPALRSTENPRGCWLSEKPFEEAYYEPCHKLRIIGVLLS